MIWIGGPLLAFADHRPLESERARIIFIATLLALYIGYRLVKAYRARQSNSGFFSALSTEFSPDPMQVLAASQAYVAQPSAATNDLFELAHGADDTGEHDVLASWCVNAGRE